MILLILLLAGSPTNITADEIIGAGNIRNNTVYAPQEQGEYTDTIITYTHKGDIILGVRTQITYSVYEPKATLRDKALHIQKQLLDALRAIKTFYLRYVINR